MGQVLPPSPPPPGWGHRGSTPPPVPAGYHRLFPPLLLLRCGDVEPHLGPMRVAMASVISLLLHWHTVAEWRTDVRAPSWGGGGGSTSTSTTRSGTAVRRGVPLDPLGGPRGP